jgi:hypothetical protein
MKVLGGRPPPSPDDVVRLVVRGNVIPGSASSVAIERAAFDRAGPFDVQLRSAEDWDMWIRLARHGPPACVPEPLVAQRLHSSNMSLDADVILTAVASVERRHGVHADRGGLYRWLAASSLRTGQRSQWARYLWLAVVHGEPVGAANDVLDAVRGRIDRYRGRFPRPLALLPNPEWTFPAQAWLDELRLALDIDAERDAADADA